MYQHKTLNGEKTVFCDPITLSPDGKSSLMTTAFSRDGKYFAYGFSKPGPDWITMKIKRVDPSVGQKECLDEELQYVKSSGIAWTYDSKGFFYSVR